MQARLWCLGEVDSAWEGEGEVVALCDTVGGVSRMGIGRGAWRAEKKPGRSGFGSTRGREAVLVCGAARGRPGGQRRRTDAVVGRVQGGRGGRWRQWQSRK